MGFSSLTLRPQCNPPVEARQLVRRMKGGAQAHLIEGNDGNCYVVKFQNNPQHRRILINELFASIILRQLQIAAPEFRFIQISPDFLAANPKVKVEVGRQQLPPDVGLHFGSRYPGHPSTTPVFDLIPDRMFAQLANYEQFRGALVFDRWVSNVDSRQAIFLRTRINEWLVGPNISQRNVGFIALMIDHGFIFAGPYWRLSQSAITGLYARRHVYTGVRSLDDFEPWLSRVDDFPSRIFEDALRQIPEEWMEGDESALHKLLEQLIRRQKRIREIVREARDGDATLFTQWKEF